MIMESWGCILLPKGLDSTHHYSLNTYFLEVNEGLLGSAVSGITGYINDKYTHIYIIKYNRYTTTDNYIVIGAPFPSLFSFFLP